MSATMTGLENIDKTIHKTNEMLNNLKENLYLEDKQHAYHVLRAFLFALRDRLPTDEAANFAAQLPTFVRGLFYEGWRPSDTPKKFSPQEFIDYMEGAIGVEVSSDIREVAKTAWKEIKSDIGEGKADDLRSILPEEMVNFLES